MNPYWVPTGVVIVIEDPAGQIDYDESGTGPTIVFVPGSCSTGTAWRPVIATLSGRYRCVTTSLLGYGGTAERRTKDDPSIAHEADVVEAVIGRTGGPVHLVGHSFGGEVSVAVAARQRVSLISLTVVETPAPELLRSRGEQSHFQAVQDMCEAYFSAFQAGDPNAISVLIDFFGGPGTFASWPAKVRAYAVQTTPVNILDWASATQFPLMASTLSMIKIPVRVVVGSASPPAFQRSNALLAECIEGATIATIKGAAHFLIATHADQVAALIAENVQSACDLQQPFT